MSAFAENPSWARTEPSASLVAMCAAEQETLKRSAERRRWPRNAATAINFIAGFALLYLSTLTFVESVIADIAIGAARPHPPLLNYLAPFTLLIMSILALLTGLAFWCRWEAWRGLALTLLGMSIMLVVFIIARPTSFAMRGGAGNLEDAEVFASFWAAALFLLQYLLNLRLIKDDLSPGHRDRPDQKKSESLPAAQDFDDDEWPSERRYRQTTRRLAIASNRVCGLLLLGFGVYVFFTICLQVLDSRNSSPAQRTVVLLLNGLFPTWGILAFLTARGYVKGFYYARILGLILSALALTTLVLDFSILAQVVRVPFVRDREQMVMLPVLYLVSFLLLAHYYLNYRVVCDANNWIEHLKRHALPRPDPADFGGEPGPR